MPTGIYTRPSAETRFWEKVDKSGPLCNGTPCWIWLAGINKDGYGCFSWNGKRGLASRFAYEFLVGLIPEGLTLDHLCRNRACVNPIHLQPVSLRDNVLRGNTFCSQNARRTHCIHGHPFDIFNTLITPQGWRRCRACNRIAIKRYQTKESVSCV